MAKDKRIRACSSERQQYLAHAFNDNTIRFLLHYPGLLDPDALRRATEALVSAVDVLHGSFYVKRIHAYWRIHGDGDFSGCFRQRRDADPVRAAQDLSVEPVAPEEKVKLRVTLVQNDAVSSLLVSISHLCVDGSDGKYLLQKLVEGYNRILSTGSTQGMVVKNGNRAPEQLYRSMTRKEIRQLMVNPLNDVKSLYPFPTEEPGTARCVTRTIPAPVMAAARARAKAVGASANDLLVAALNQAYAQLPGIAPGTPVSVTSMIDLRRHCQGGDSEGLSNMAGALPTLLAQGVPERFADTLTAIAAQTRAIKEDPYAGLRGVPLLHTAIQTAPMGFLLKVAGRVYEKMSVGMTNLGNLSCADFALGGLVPTGGSFGGPLKKKPGMQISVISFDGECVLACYGRYTDTDAIQLQQTLDSMVGFIGQYGSNKI